MEKTSNHQTAEKIDEKCASSQGGAPRRLKVLLGCYACSPCYGSEPGMGWNFASHIARWHDVHVIVEKNEFEETLARFSREHPEAVEHMTFHFVPRVHHETLRKFWPPSYYHFYRRWHKRAYELAQELDAKEHFDIVHQITIAGFREPGYLWKLGKPFVWGPLGGFADAPWCLIRYLGFYGCVFLGVRTLINAVHKRWGRNRRAAARAASAILVSTKDGMEAVRRFWRRDAYFMSEVGLENSSFPHSVEGAFATRKDPPLRICWAGNLIPGKALDLLIRALPLCKEKMELHVLGKGPRMTAWKGLASRLRVEDWITFYGGVERKEVFRIMEVSHVFCITSVCDATSTVLLEAFSHRLPIIALDHCGFSTAIDDTCGIKIPIRSLSQVIADYARSLDFLAAHEDVRQRLAAGALERCRYFTWESKMQMLNKIYSNVVQG